ncbi:ABC transporter ATP-binding protein [Brucella pituitosa]|uniref:Sn-glycerol-3-phosphate ABC transporter ATP-binding protein UgpC n=1 Tax=Brucella pituitosa TaxID=571256 RepID=A0ABS3K5U3_9HYPH|nr:sn-glycerol-3-phosphate ABC transporter ATP-binding protein UgpC [Brucella pituitosa]MBO1042263.1 sn-glycerol-3-phosphate ABC transporter ATP-binding protein UgpC [Brucella pituitosa]
MSAAIEIRNVTKNFGNLTVLDDISLNVNAGEFVAFLGPSGCGKSTLLRMIAGLETLSSGEIRLGGNRIDELKPGARGVAMVFQSYALYPHMTVRQNLSFGLENINTSKSEIERRVNSAAQILEIASYLDRKPQQLSGGQRQRVAIGRAIVKEPKAFLFDEPLSNLDAALRGRTRLELASLHQRLGATMVFVTHDQVEAMTLADRIVVMNACKIEQIGTPTEIYQRPATRFVAGFVGTPAMSFLRVLSAQANSDRTSIDVSGIGALRLPMREDGLEIETMGVRPEDVKVVNPEEVGCVKAKVEIVERLGERTLLYTRLNDGSQLTAQADGRTLIKAKDEIYLKPDLNFVHLFAQDGRAIPTKVGTA